MSAGLQVCLIVLRVFNTMVLMLIRGVLIPASDNSLLDASVDASLQALISRLVFT